MLVSTQRISAFRSQNQAIESKGLRSCATWVLRVTQPFCASALAWGKRSIYVTQMRRAGSLWRIQQDSPQLSPAVYAVIPRGLERWLQRSSRYLCIGIPSLPGTMLEPTLEPHLGPQLLANICGHDSQGELLFQKVLSSYLGQHCAL